MTSVTLLPHKSIVIVDMPASQAVLLDVGYWNGGRDKARALAIAEAYTGKKCEPRTWQVKRITGDGRGFRATFNVEM